jgi:peptidyl-prolyl cis-trans isomerase D
MAKPPRPKIVSKKHLARMEREQIQRRYLIIGAAVVLLLIVGVVLYGFLDQNYLQARKPVAKVDNQTITLQQFQTRVKFQRIQLINRYQSTLQFAQAFGQDPTTGYFASTLQQIQTQLEDPNTLGSSVVTQLVDEKLIQQEAQKLGITVSDAEVDDRIQSFFGYFPNGTPVPTVTPTEPVYPTLNPTELSIVTITPTPTEIPTGTPTTAPTQAGATPTAQQAAPAASSTPAASPTVEASPTPQPSATPYTAEGFKTESGKYYDEMKTYGITQADLREIFHADLLQQKVMDKITADVKPAEDQVWARHILVADEASAQAVEARLKKGEDFGKVAKEVSTDTGSKDNGGDLGWFGKGQMVAEFDKVAFSLKIGQISDPVKSQYGYHIIQVLGHEVRPLTADQFTTAKQKVFSDWLTGLNADTKRVQKFDGTWQGKVPTDPAFTPQAQ